MCLEEGSQQGREGRFSGLLVLRCAAQPTSLVSFNFHDIISKEFLFRCLKAASKQESSRQCLLLLSSPLRGPPPGTSPFIPCVLLRKEHTEPIGCPWSPGAVPHAQKSLTLFSCAAKVQLSNTTQPLPVKGRPACCKFVFNPLFQK